MRNWLLGLMLTVMIGCAAITNPDSIPPHGRLLAVPALFAVMWQETEACSGITADMNRVTWFSAPTLEVDGQKAAGYTNWRAHYISLADPLVVLVEQGDTIAAKIVRHEMLHDLIQQSGHPAEFGSLCASVVANWH